MRFKENEELTPFHKFKMNYSCSCPFFASFYPFFRFNINLFVAGVDTRSAQMMATREKQWQKYQKVVELVKFNDAMEHKPAEG